MYDSEVYNYGRFKTIRAIKNQIIWYVKLNYLKK